MYQNNNLNKNIYIDQNIFADLSSGRFANASNYLNKIQDAIKQKRLIIVPSLEIFEELIPVYQSDSSQFKKRWKLIHELVNWSYSLKQANDILSNYLKTDNRQRRRYQNSKQASLINAR